MSWAVESNTNHVYASGSLYNNNFITSIPLSLSNPRSTPLISVPEDYVVGVTKFHIPSSSIPIFAFQNNTYQLSMLYSGTAFTVFLNYISDNYPLGDNNNQYIWNISQFLDSVNNAASAATTALLTAFPSLASSITFAPYCSYNPISTLLYWTLPQAMCADITAPSSLVQMVFNEILYCKFFITFRTINFDSHLSQNSGPHILYVSSNHGLNINAQGYVVITQDATSISNWKDITQIVLKTTNLPIRVQSLPPPPGYGGTVVDSTDSVLATFNISSTAQDAIESVGYDYVPAFIKWIDLLGTNPIYIIDVQAFWRDGSGLQHPIVLYPSESFQIELLFISKRVSSEEKLYEDHRANGTNMNIPSGASSKRRR
jgi:hypothetical protein